MKETKVISMQEAVAKIPSGCRLMIGGFAGSAAPNEIIQEMVKAGVKDLTLICNDTGDLNIPGEHVGILTPNHCVKKAIVSHIGMNRYTVDRLLRAGVAASAIGRCTYADEASFFSYRRATHREEPDYGRQISAIVLEDC